MLKLVIRLFVASLFNCCNLDRKGQNSFFFKGCKSEAHVIGLKGFFANLKILQNYYKVKIIQ